MSKWIRAVQMQVASREPLLRLPELIGSADTGDSSRKQWFIAAKIGKITFLCRRFIVKQYYENDGPLETLRTAYVTLSMT